MLRSMPESRTLAEKRELVPGGEGGIYFLVMVYVLNEITF